ncbi:uncharacterized protein MYCFIDRAFT_210844 [Pseudocercospora fijiensis CIRAD86]|uniref:Peptide N-acetyl-beta-D-glucosaminyl asparaginase amidase A N-terminal domain-containing protein n=1 Tax=Pseudocercospora fijiensis (strain CIRAD86) TaxID=383855 RepID=M3B4M2_PSEFD|nr:uncharacterized protein MYCFIDRAFT_210844 [Pseudocercospora fijiensis CIRAD86]EME84297.1 hypothetical protein MYCFIDRAFT_182312 [Pseudocercospora fijiensis CIRAD86]
MTDTRRTTLPITPRQRDAAQQIASEEGRCISRQSASCYTECTAGTPAPEPRMHQEDRAEIHSKSLCSRHSRHSFLTSNLINDICSACFNVTLTAAYFTADDSLVAADLVVPISNRTGNQGQASVFQFPQDTASNTVTLSRNIVKAIFTIAATGQSVEEFWFGNALQSDIYTFNETYGDLPGFSPFREVQVFIDGQLAGVVWPFPIIFTGGVVPGLWRPVVGIDAFDLKEDEIDITPWLPLLCDGNPHNFGLAVSGLNDSSGGQAILSETTDQYWLLSGKIFV